MIGNALDAMSFLSRLPLGSRMAGDLKKSVTHFPLAGYIAFGAYLSVQLLCKYLFRDTLVSVMVAAGTVYYLFNLLHFDGFMDSVDGLSSQKSKDEIVRIMKQGNVGPNALFWGAIYLVLKIYLLMKLHVMAAAPMLVIGRWGMGFSCSIAKPARPGGLGALFLGGNSSPWLLSCIYIIGLFLFMKTAVILACLAVIVIADVFIVHAISRLIGGMTGDTIGFINETDELLVLLTIYVFSVNGMNILR